MNKQEVISKLKSAIPKNNIDDYQRGEAAGLNFALLLLAELDELKRPAVPRYVADFYESIKDDFEGGVYELCTQFYEDEAQLSDELHDWFVSSENKPIETLVKMRLYGYERREYKVALKSNGFYIGIHQEDGQMKTVFTRNELAEYGFNNLDEYEVTEVEE